MSQAARNWRPISLQTHDQIGSFGAKQGLAAIGRRGQGRQTELVQGHRHGLGRVAFRSGRPISPSDLMAPGFGGRRQARRQTESFQWMETPTGELILMSLQTNRYLRIDKSNGSV